MYFREASKGYEENREFEFLADEVIWNAGVVHEHWCGSLELNNGFLCCKCDGVIMIQLLNY